MGIKILIDAGHGGNETGASANGYIEKDLNLQTSLLLRTELNQCGFDVTMTRETDLDIDLVERGNRAKGCNCIISIHFNACSPAGTGKGTEQIHSFNNESAKWLAMCINKEVLKLGLYDRGVWTKESSIKGKNYYGVLRHAEPVAGVILEGLFIDNLNDTAFLKKPDFLKNLAIAYAKGICVAYGIAYVEASFVQPITNSNDCNWLKENGWTNSLHKKGETLTFGDLERILIKKYGK